MKHIKLFEQFINEAASLVDEKTGKTVKLPYKTKDFRGDPVTVVGFTEPHKSASSGRIETSDGGSYFPGVAGLKIVGHQFESSVNEAAWDKLNKKAEDVYGEFGFATLDVDDMSKCIDMKKADKLADKMFGEFGFTSLSEEEMKSLINKNPSLVIESSVNEAVGIPQINALKKMMDDHYKKDRLVIVDDDEVEYDNHHLEVYTNHAGVSVWYQDGAFHATDSNNEDEFAKYYNKYFGKDIKKAAEGIISYIG